MSTKQAKNIGTSESSDPDFINAEIAMKRAAQKARQRARQAGIGVIVMQDGEIVEEKPDHMVENHR